MIPLLVPHHVNIGRGETGEVRLVEHHTTPGGLNGEPDVDGCVAVVLNAAPHALLVGQRVPVVPFVRVAHQPQVLLEVPGHCRGPSQAQVRTLVPGDVLEHQPGPGQREILVVGETVTREALGGVVRELVQTRSVWEVHPSRLPLPQEMPIKERKVLPSLVPVPRTQFRIGQHHLDELCDAVGYHPVMHLVLAAGRGGGLDRPSRAHRRRAGKGQLTRLNTRNHHIVGNRRLRDCLALIDIPHHQLPGLWHTDLIGVSGGVRHTRALVHPLQRRLNLRLAHIP